jgi:hypothetical protein
MRNHWKILALPRELPRKHVMVAPNTIASVSKTLGVEDHE